MRNADFTFRKELNSCVRNNPELKRKMMYDAYFRACVETILNSDDDLSMAEVVVRVIDSASEIINKQTADFVACKANCPKPIIHSIREG